MFVLLFIWWVCAVLLSNIYVGYMLFGLDLFVLRCYFYVFVCVGFIAVFAVCFWGCFG